MIPLSKPDSPVATTSKKLHLKIPVKLGVMRYRELEFSRVTAIGAFIASRGSNLDTAIVGLAISAGVPQDVIERMGPRDYVRACEIMTELHPELGANG